MSETTPEPTEPDTAERDDEQVEDVEPLAEDEMTEGYPVQGRTQDDPALGTPPEVDNDDA